MIGDDYRDAVAIAVTPEACRVVSLMSDEKLFEMGLVEANGNRQQAIARLTWLLVDASMKEREKRLPSFSSMAPMTL